jgi:hypothetical protein
VRPRRQGPALLCGPSTSPLDVMATQPSTVAPLVALVAILGTGPGNAADRCSGIAVIEVRSLAGLPADLRKQLPATSRGLRGLADRGGAFNVTDVVDDSLPMRRFTLAAVGATCAVVAVEYGGYSHGFELTEYRLAAAGWGSVWRSTVLAEPRSVRDLLGGQRTSP